MQEAGGRHRAEAPASGQVRQDTPYGLDVEALARLAQIVEDVQSDGEQTGKYEAQGQAPADTQVANDAPDAAAYSFDAAEALSRLANIVEDVRSGESVGEHRAQEEAPANVRAPEAAAQAPRIAPQEIAYSFDAVDTFSKLARTEGGVAFGEPIEKRPLPRPSRPWANASRTIHGVTGFYESVRGLVDMGEAFHAVQEISNGIVQYRAGPVRRTLFEAPILRWRESEGLNAFMGGIRELYDAGRPESCVRNDLKMGDLHGTNVYVGHSDGMAFLLVERDVIAENLAGRKYVARRLEFVDISRRATFQEVLNEFSLLEELAVRAALDKMDITESQYAAALAAANRRTVRSGSDISRLVFQQEAKAKSGWRAMLGRLAAGEGSASLAPRHEARHSRRD